MAMFPFSDAVRATIFDILLGEACPKQVVPILVSFFVYNLCQVDVSFVLLNCKHIVFAYPGALTRPCHIFVLVFLLFTSLLFSRSFYYLFISFTLVF